MTDLEITKLCAEAMGLSVRKESKEGELPAWIVTQMPGTYLPSYDYYPLHDDAQAMALVKKLLLDISHCAPSGWMVFSGNGDGVDKFDEDLNRAICECVAKMQQANKAFDQPHHGHERA